MLERERGGGREGGRMVYSGIHNIGREIRGRREGRVGPGRKRWAAKGGRVDLKGIEEGRVLQSLEA